VAGQSAHDVRGIPRTRTVAGPETFTDSMGTLGGKGFRFRSGVDRLEPFSCAQNDKKIANTKPLEAVGVYRFMSL